MSAAHVRRGAPARGRASRARSAPQAIAKRLPVSHARANRLAGLAFAAFLLAIGVVVLVALDIPVEGRRPRPARRSAAPASPSAATRSSASTG